MRSCSLANANTLWTDIIAHSHAHVALTALTWLNRAIGTEFISTLFYLTFITSMFEPVYFLKIMPNFCQLVNLSNYEIKLIFGHQTWNSTTQLTPLLYILIGQMFIKSFCSKVTFTVSGGFSIFANMKGYYRLPKRYWDPTLFYYLRVL